MFNVISTPVTTTQTLSDQFEELLVTTTGSITPPEGENAVVCDAYNQTVVIEGTVAAANTYAILLGNAPDATSDTLQITSTGVVSAGVLINQINETINNAGEIIAANGQAVVVDNSGANTINNSGTISGQISVYLINNQYTEDIENSGTLEASVGPTILSVTSGGSPSNGISVINSGLITNAAANPIGTYGGVLSFDDSAGSTSTVDNTGTISGNGYVIQSMSDILNISNSGTVHGGLFSNNQVTIDNSGLWQGATGAVDGLLLDGVSSQITNSGKIDATIDFGVYAGSLTNAQSGTIAGPVAFTEASDYLDNAGAIDGAVTFLAGYDDFINAGMIDGVVTFDGTGANNSLTNSGTITGNVNLSAGTSGTVKNHHEIYGDVILGASDTLLNTGIIHGDVTLGASDMINDSRGQITDAINASTSDLFVYKGLFGEETINNFVAGIGSTHDTIQFAANDFSSFGSVMGSTRQVGADSVITLDAADSITLAGVAKSSLVSTNFTFT
jgi:hypothetical protein